MPADLCSINFTLMKKKILTLLLCNIVFFAKGQQACGDGWPPFVFQQSRQIKIIYHLGKSPQIDFLRGITEAAAFVSALKSNTASIRYHKDINELNRIFRAIGFAGGISDPAFSAASVHWEMLPNGIRGYMGDNAERYTYVLLELEEGANAGWKLTGPEGCYVYIFTKCGNIFFPQDTLPSPKTCDSCAYNVRLQTVAIALTHDLKGTQVVNIYRRSRQNKHQKGLGAKVLAAQYEIPYDISLSTADDSAHYQFDKICTGGNLSVILSPPAFRADNLKAIDLILPDKGNCDQRFMISLNSGIVIHTLPAHTAMGTAASHNGVHSSSQLMMGFTPDAQLTYGLAFSEIPLSYKESGAVVKIANPAIPVQGFVGYAFGTHALRPVVMMAAGYAFISNSSITAGSSYLNTGYRQKDGFAGTTGIGLRYDFNCKTALSLDARAVYLASKDQNDTDTGIFAFPMALGLIFKL